MKFVSVSTCKERWHQLVREYKNSETFLTLHDVTFDLVRECIRKDIKANHSCFDEIEEDVLSKLFLEDKGPNNSTSETLSIENIDRNTTEEHEDNSSTFLGVPSNHGSHYVSGYHEYSEDYSDFESELIDEACSVSCYDLSFNSNCLHEETFYSPSDPLPPFDVFYNGEDVDEYYTFFEENNLNKFPVIFDDIVDSLFDHLDEESGDEARSDIVKLLCDRVRVQKPRRQ